MKHKPYKKLKGILREKEITYRNLAEILGVTEASVCQKINGKSDFYISEINVICNSLSVDTDIFLN